MLKGYIFDMDGVLVDNHLAHFEAWMEMSRKYDFALNDEIYKTQFNGKTNADLFRSIFGADISADRLQELVDEKEKMYHDIYRDQMQPLEGLVDFFEWIKENDFKMALGTSAPTKNVDFVLDTLDLRKYFDFIIDGSGVSQGKPHPEVYLKCIEGLGLSSSECVVFEDAILGIKAAVAAKAKVIAVATTHNVLELLPHARYIISDFNSVEEVLETL